MGSVTCLAVFLLSFKAVNSAALGSDFSGLGGTATLGEGSRKKGWRLTSPHPLGPRAPDTGPGGGWFGKVGASGRHQGWPGKWDWTWLGALGWAAP